MAFRSEALDELYSGKTAERGDATAVPAARSRPSAGVTRGMDIAVSLIALTALLPVLIVVAVAVRCSSRGPVIFQQRRVGLRGREFTMLKFRTMRTGTDDAAHRAFVRAMLTPGAEAEVARTGLHKLDDDRVTRLGAVLRRTSIDELPQLVNVLAGSMSLVGPRPVLPWEVELLQPEDLVRFEVKPGMTGLWQVSGRSRLPMDVAFRLDREYVARRSLWLDLKILLKTIPALFAGDSA
jgi:lipopolysaccharide/colanic/teichoic acid biosynthesis glycosyltransferase